MGVIIILVGLFCVYKGFAEKKKRNTIGTVLLLTGGLLCLLGLGYYLLVILLLAGNS